MDTPMPSKMRLVIVGATGMVGGYVLRYALEHPASSRSRLLGGANLESLTPSSTRSSIKISLTAPHLRSRFLAKMQRSFASEHIRGRSQTRNCAKSPLTTQLNSQEFSTSVVLVPRSRSSVGVVRTRVVVVEWPSRATRERLKQPCVDGILPCLYLPTCLHLPCRATQRAESWLPRLTRGLSRVSDSFPKPSDSCR